MSERIQKWTPYTNVHKYSFFRNWKLFVQQKKTSAFSTLKFVCSAVSTDFSRRKLPKNVELRFLIYPVWVELSSSCKINLFGDRAQRKVSTYIWLQLAIDVSRSSHVNTDLRLYLHVFGPICILHPYLSVRALLLSLTSFLVDLGHI